MAPFGGTASDAIWPGGVAALHVPKVLRRPLEKMPRPEGKAMTADELFNKHWPPNVNRSLWTDAHRHVAEVMFKVAWAYLHDTPEEEGDAPDAISILKDELRHANERIKKAITYLDPDIAIPSEPGRALAVLKEEQ